MQITNNQYNTMPEQVQENKNNIEELAKNLKEIFNVKGELETDATTVNISLIRDWKAGTTTGFILDTTGKLFNIIAVDETTIYVKYWATLTSGPQGPRGPQGLRGPEGPTGPQGPQGQDGTGFENLTDVNLVVGEPSVTYDTEDGITVVSQGSFETTGDTYSPTVENNIPLIAGNGLTMDATEDGQHVDIHLSAETVSTLMRALKTPISIPSKNKIVTINTSNEQELVDADKIVQIGSLWKNPNPTAEFASQAVQLSSNNYDYLIINFDNYKTSIIVNKNDITFYQENTASCPFKVAVEGSWKMAIIIRNFIFENYGQILFYGGEQTIDGTVTATGNQNALKPVEILGLKIGV